MERVKDDRGGTVMTVDRLYRHLLQKLINANIDIDAYLQLRKAKGYMSVSENDHLRDNLFELCREMRAQAPAECHSTGGEGCPSPGRRIGRRRCTMPDERAS